jgi:hypothetical protein
MLLYMGRLDAGKDSLRRDRVPVHLPLPTKLGGHKVSALMVLGGCTRAGDGSE